MVLSTRSIIISFLSECLSVQVLGVVVVLVAACVCVSPSSSWLLCRVIVIVV